MVSLRGFDIQNDYATLDEWWRGHGADHAPDPLYLSSTGLVAEVDHKPVAMIFMYHTNSGICHAEFFTVNPKASKKDRELGLEKIIEASKNWAKVVGYKLIYVSTNERKYIKRLESSGFEVKDKNMIHCFYDVV